MTNEIAAEIANQIGRSALCMMGAKNLMAGPRSLQFKVSGSPLRVNSIQVSLAEDDTYDVAFFYVKKLQIQLVSRSAGVRAEDLGRILRDHTGLETRMPRVVGINA